MTVDEAFELVENRDYPEGLKRKFAPGYSLIHVARTGEIASVLRYKQLPTEQDQMDAIAQNRGCAQLMANPGMYSSSEELQKRIERILPMFEKLKVRQPLDFDGRTG